MIASTRKGWIGVDLGSHVVKLAQLERRGSGYALTAAVAIARTQPWSGALLQAPARSSQDELTAALSLAPFTGRTAACNLTMSACEFSELTQSLEEFANPQAALVEILDEMHGPLPDGRTADYWRGSLGDGRKSRDHVLTLATSSMWAKQIARDQSRIGLACRRLDGLPTSLARAVSLARASHAAAGPIAAIDWGYSQATFCVVADGVAQFVRRLPGAELSVLLAALQLHVGVSPEEACGLLTRHGLGSPGEPVNSVQSLLAKSLAPVLEAVLAEVERTFDYLQAYRRGLVPRELMLFGGGATIPHVDALLAESLSVPVSVWTLDAEMDTEPSAPLALFGPAAALSRLGWA